MPDSPPAPAGAPARSATHVVRAACCVRCDAAGRTRVRPAVADRASGDGSAPAWPARSCAARANGRRTGAGRANDAGEPGPSASPAAGPAAASPQECRAGCSRRARLAQVAQVEPVEGGVALARPAGRVGPAATRAATGGCASARNVGSGCGCHARTAYAAGRQARRPRTHCVDEGCRPPRGARSRGGCAAAPAHRSQGAPAECLRSVVEVLEHVLPSASPVGNVAAAKQSHRR